MKPWQRPIPPDEWAAITACRDHRATLGLPGTLVAGVTLRKPRLCEADCPVVQHLPCASERGQDDTLLKIKREEEARKLHRAIKPDGD